MEANIIGVTLLSAALFVQVAIGAPDGDVKWLVSYQGDAIPQEPQWRWHGARGASIEIVNGTLHLADNAEDDVGYYRTLWTPEEGHEIIVEARVRVKSITREDGTAINSLRPYSHGAPVGILVGNGQREDGIVLWPDRISTFMDRFHVMSTTDDFHVYRLVIRGSDMSVYVDGEMRIRGKDAFSTPSTDGAAFLQFGSNCKRWRGDAYWDYVKLGIRRIPPTKLRETQEKLKITISDRWEIPPPKGMRWTRPYLYNVGDGLLLLSVAQGPDALYEPYGVLKSTDEGKTWVAVSGLMEKTFAPQPMLRLPDGRILGASRWVVKYKPGNYTGFTYIFDRNADSFEMYESKLIVPAEVELPVFDRDIFRFPDGRIMAVIYDIYAGYLVQTTDLGKTWTFVSRIGAKHEPGVEFLSETEAVALLRQGSMLPLHQVWSHDGGKTWSAPVVLEEGSVDPDVVYMSNGVLACSYGRPRCHIMFSTDKGKTWGYHHVLPEPAAFNYAAIREIRPGRLLYVYDALAAVYVDVKRVK